MAGTRTVYRGNKGRFAGASAGKPETVKSGGFANAAFRARVNSAPRATQQASRPQQASRQNHKSLTTAGKVAVVGVAAYSARRRPVATAAVAAVVYKASKKIAK